MNDLKQIFIGGCERSGTTLIGSILGAHPSCICTPESQFITHFYRRENFNPNKIDPFLILDVIRHHKRYRLEWKGALDFPKKYILENFYKYSEFLKWIARCYAETEGKTHVTWWIDQTPNNMKRAMTLIDLFPEALFIHLVRDGRAVSASLMNLEWGPNNVIRCAEYWLAKIAPGLILETTLGNDRVMRVYYEDLIQRPETVLSKICRFTGVPYSSEMVHSRGYKPAAYNQKQHALVTGGLDTDRIVAWKKKLSFREIEMFEFITGETLKILGYEQMFGLKACPPTKKETVSLHLRNIYTRLANIIRQKSRVRKSLKR